ncbi:6748_t:CDS:2 [Gigaspora margarita]|uniref:6748_t:CDS:1 n=1 Tax=Gigaspora margarita TaxID=4874 RepID=A0ABN7VLE6_GIGMA|nr:6748_t:CDS:2 [Gigaspora margarita]
MTSIFIALYFIKTISGSKKCIYKNAVYRSNKQEFRELTYKKSEIIVLYTNQNGRYNALKDNLKKIVLSVIGRLKIAQTDINNHLKSIEERYTNSRKRQQTNLSSSSLSKLQKTDSQPNNSTSQNNKSPAEKFLQAVNQIKNAEPEPQK